MEFIKEENRIYAKNEKGVLIAEITFQPRENNVYNIDYTFVDESLRGQGIAGKLVQEAVNTIKAKGGIVKATCSYADKWLQEHKIQ